jgi:hypothetical protein
VTKARPPGGQRPSDDDLPPAPTVRRKKKKAAEPEAKAQRPVWFRYATWAAMILFSVAAIVELRAQYYYRHNLGVAHEALERVEGAPSKVTYDQIKDRFWGTPEESTGVHEFVSNVVYTWSWHGLRKYTVKLYVSPKDGQVRTVETGDTAP